MRILSSGTPSVTNLTSDGNLVEMSSNVNITGKLNIGGTLSVGGDLNVSGNTTYSLKNGTRHLFGMNTKGFNSVQQQKLTASDAANSDEFGYSVSLFEDYALIAGGVVFGSRVSIGSHSLIGVGANISPYISIGKNVIVGTGSAVIKNLPDNIIAAGVPAQILRENPKK